MLRDGVLITTIAQRDRKRKPVTAYTLPAEVDQTGKNVDSKAHHEFTGILFLSLSPFSPLPLLPL